MIVASSQGGVDIESVAAENPDAIIKFPVQLSTGLTKEGAKEIATKMGFTPKCIDGAADLMQRLYKLFIERDATQVEINPMAESASGEGRLVVSRSAAAVII
jgi:succinyl-CoA synthetase beta subunit